MEKKRKKVFSKEQRCLIKACVTEWTRSYYFKVLGMPEMTKVTIQQCTKKHRQQ